MVYLPKKLLCSIQLKFHKHINKKSEKHYCVSRLTSGYQDSNLGPPAPKAGALTGLRYTPFLLSLSVVVSQMRCKGSDFL